MTTWTDERIQEMTKLYFMGLSASDIARRMNCGLSRNAVIGKFHRLGLPPRGQRKIKRPEQVIKIKQKIRAARKQRASAAVFQMASQPLPPDDIAPLTAKALMDLEPNDCRYPYGDGPFSFCGCERAEGLPYCEHHARKAYQPPQVRPSRHEVQIEKERAVWAPEKVDA